jgi:hypothetical protein
LDTQSENGELLPFASKAVRLPQPAPWIEDVSTGSGQIPVQAVKTIVDWVSVP